jgi:DHA2 family multidrug resistance protein
MFLRFGPAYRWYALATLTFANIAVLMSSTVVSVAIPQVMGAFGIGQDQAQWLSTANLAAATIAMLISTWSVTRFGLRNTVVYSLVIFSAGSLLSGLAPNIELLILGRILQGITVGVIGPLLMSLIFQLFPSAQQGLAMGIASVGLIMAPTLGPSVGGFLVDQFNWRYVMFLGLPISLLCTPVAAMLFPNRESSTTPAPFDWTGFVSLSLAVSGLLALLSNGEREGWDSDGILILGTLVVLVTAVFIRSQMNSDSPVLDLRLFANRQFAIFSLIAFVFGAGLYASMYIIPVFLQLVQFKSPTESGLILLPSGIAMTLIFPLSGKYADRVDTRLLIALGVLLFAASFLLMNQSDANTGFWTYTWWLVLGRVGLAVVLPPLNVCALQSVPQEQLHGASGAINFARQLGGAFGVSIVSVLLARRTNFHADPLMNNLRLDNGEMLEWLRHSQRLMAEAGLVGIDQIASSLVLLSRSVRQQAMVLGFQDTFLIVAGIFLLTLLPTMLLKTRHND